MSYLNHKIVKKEETEKHNALHLLISSMPWRNAEKAPVTDNEIIIICNLVNKIFYCLSQEKPNLKVLPKVK